MEKNFSYYIESVKFKKGIEILDEGITGDLLKFPYKDIFQTFNTLSREQRKAILDLLSAAENKKLSIDDRKNALYDLKSILLKKNPNLVAKLAKI